MQTILIGNVKIKKTACLAPMASVADRAYRTLCMEYGAAYCVGEMASSNALCYSDRKTAHLLASSLEEQPMAVQLFGNSPDNMARAAELACAFHPQVIDVNMGCPVPKVTGNGCGSALMKTPELAYAIIKAMTNATDIPITVKIRKGFDESNVNAPEFAKRMQDAGAAAITIHGRTRQQMYRPPVDLSVIKAVKDSVDIPVIGNGGVTCGREAKEMYDRTGCDLVMIGQGSYGRPWVFKEIKHFLETGESLPEPPLEERLDVMLRHVSMMVENDGEKLGMMEARKHAAWYIKGSKGAAAFRHACGQLRTYSDLKILVERVKAEQKREEK